VVLTVVALVAATALGFALAMLMMDRSAPPSFEEPQAVSDVPVSEREFDDARTVDVALTFGEEVELVTPLSGKVTSLACGSGAAFVSGQSNLTVDGQLVVNLATATPLWRDLTWGMNGADVQGLRAELVRLGRSVDADGAVDQRLLNAFAQVFRDLGETKFPADGIPATRVLWLPTPEVTASECPVSVGGNATAGEPVASIAGRLTSATIAHLPEGAAAGSRLLRVDGTDIPLENDAVTSAEGLATLMGSASFAQAISASQSTLTGSYLLAQPLRVSVVPPGALYNLSGDQGCVLAQGTPRAVTVVGSELGQSFVVFPDEPPSSVVLSPQDPPSCD
jgi:hypothetical protein